ncbi:hypothetical protein BOTBODRAFT_140806 [Botryobasidium botryosum FD-172 SS1]|uniref:Dethiobiotin synthase n=1 Tax=Botryobasidium botryosum (strain FD-172 SS1) TaxID=930990 RepID=A0A067M4D4_BOTB1|nr:hypothetical protein BOTBODRAFT_140806 [Botryobasidium botryosum FD-172 SS1]
MSLLYKHLRVHQIFGANTDVGKTILSTALCRATALRHSQNVFYLKPVSTGNPEDADDGHVTRFTGSAKGMVRTDCIYKYKDPVSPHLAATREARTREQKIAVPSDMELTNAIAQRVRAAAASSADRGVFYIETAGGVHSPTLSGSSQADAYRPLLLPTLLVADSRLGGISSTISAYESLILRGFTIDAVLLFREEYYRNWEYLELWFGRKGIRLSAIEPPPLKSKDPQEDKMEMHRYYEEVCEKRDEVAQLVEELQTRHDSRLESLESMPQRTLDSVWWPFTQHGLVRGPKDVTVIDSAFGDFFSVYQDPKGRHTSGPSSVLRPHLDGSASWWTQAFGHAHPEITLAAAQAAGRYGHVIFPLATNEPALTLAERLVKDGPGKGWAQRAFFSDNGSTGMEVALKMAIKAAAVRYGANGRRREKELQVIGLKGGYHGDTIGAMDACDGNVYNAAVEWYRGRGFWFDPPSVGIHDGQVVVTGSGFDWDASKPLPDGMEWSPGKSTTWKLEFDTVGSVYDVQSRLDTPMAHHYKKHIRGTLERLVEDGHAFGALVIEPLVMGASGMVFVDPLFQRILIDTVRSSSDLFAGALGSHTQSLPSSADPPAWRGLPVVFDEVFVGLYRIGLQTTSPILGTTPDISVHAKILTGGLVPLSATLASSSVFNAFLGERKVDSLLHGHSYTAHPVGCAAANKTLDLIEELESGEAWSRAREMWGLPAGGIKAAKQHNLPDIWSFWDPEAIVLLSKTSIVEEVMALGTVLAVKLKDENAGYQANSANELLASVQNHLATSNSNELTPAPGGGSFGIHFRTLGSVVYFMSSLNTPAKLLRTLEASLLDVLQKT